MPTLTKYGTKEAVILDRWYVQSTKKIFALSITINWWRGRRISVIKRWKLCAWRYCRYAKRQQSPKIKRRWKWMIMRLKSLIINPILQLWKRPFNCFGKKFQSSFYSWWKLPENFENIFHQWWDEFKIDLLRTESLIYRHDGGSFAFQKDNWGFSRDKERTEATKKWHHTPKPHLITARIEKEDAMELQKFFYLFANNWRAHKYQRSSRKWYFSQYERLFGVKDEKIRESSSELDVITTSIPELSTSIREWKVRADSQ